jgi:PD-(D/E)XK nuclease superfamily
VWGVPAPPDELQPFQVRAIGSTELGSAAHEALARWHTGGGDLLELYRGPALGREMLARYLENPLARARTLGVEAGFSMSVGGARVRGLVDRICEIDGRSVLIDFKTNATLDESVLEAYRLQLRIYGMAAHRGLLPGGSDPRLVLFDLRHAEAHEVSADDELVTERVASASGRIRAGDFRLGPEHERRPCQLCAYRPVCADAREVL